MPASCKLRKEHQHQGASAGLTAASREPSLAVAG
jgi:hypothetical protein